MKNRKKYLHSTKEISKKRSNENGKTNKEENFRKIIKKWVINNLKKQTKNMASKENKIMIHEVK